MLKNLKKIDLTFLGSITILIGLFMPWVNLNVSMLNVSFSTFSFLNIVEYNQFIESIQYLTSFTNGGINSEMTSLLYKYIGVLIMTLIVIISAIYLVYIIGRTKENVNSNVLYGILLYIATYSILGFVEIRSLVQKVNTSFLPEFVSIGYGIYITMLGILLVIISFKKELTFSD